MEKIEVKWYVEDVPAHSCEAVVAGLPGVGHVGKLVVDHLVRTMKAEKVAEITSVYFPPQMYLSEDGVLRFPRNEIYFVPKTEEHEALLFLAGDCQSVGPEGHYALAEAYVKVFTLLGVKKMYTLGGYGVGRLVENPRVLGGLSSAELKTCVEAAGAVVNGAEPVGGIVGAAGMLITFGRLSGMQGVALLGETSGYLVDPVSATAVLDVLEKLVGFTADRTDLLKLADEMQAELSAFTSSVQRNAADDLRYIG
ncbi:MAG: proteasome assembly chaperone family protein [Methanocorpusculum sp.]|nr:proteasome assembly chaperone family protein [Methanocorpusculum sp.]